MATYTQLLKSHAWVRVQAPQATSASAAHWCLGRTLRVRVLDSGFKEPTLKQPKASYSWKTKQKIQNKTAQFQVCV